MGLGEDELMMGLFMSVPGGTTRKNGGWGKGQGGGRNVIL